VGLSAAFDWAECFETVSLVAQALHAGPHYVAMDFATRDRYRHAIEELARGSGRSELEIARAAVVQAKDSGVAARRVDDAGDDRRADPGFSLIGHGRLAFERALGFRARPTRRLLRAYVASATPGYLG